MLLVRQLLLLLVLQALLGMLQGVQVLQQG
jgi:hypothetical protein